MKKTAPVPPLLMPKGKMHPRPGSPPGMETDGKGREIPLEERTEEDQEKARAGAAQVASDAARDSD